MAVGVIALAEDAAVLFRGECRIVVEVRCGKFGLAREIDHRAVAGCQWPVASKDLSSEYLRPFQFTEPFACTFLDRNNRYENRGRPKRDRTFASQEKCARRIRVRKKV